MLTRTTDLPREPDGSGARAVVSAAPEAAPRDSAGGAPVIAGHAGELPLPGARGMLRSPVPAPTRRSDAGPLLLYALFAAFFMLPFASGRIVESPAGDLNAHLSGIVEARNALWEGQFPVRVAPRQLDGLRYPLLQFYGNFPYTAGALLTFLPAVNPYTAWKILTFLTVTAAGFYTYRCGLALTRQVWPSIVAGVVFVASPYLTTDIRARFAFAESVSFCLLPAVLYYSWRAFASRRRALRSVVLGGMAWAAVALSHNITFLYASALIGLFFLTNVTFRPRKDFWRFLRVGACYALGVALALWYLAAQLKVLAYITITQGTGTPIWSATFVPLRVLLSPFVTISPTAVGTPNLGLQFGWPILAATLFGVFHLVVGILRPTFRWAMLARLLVALLLAMFVVWSPFDFWRWVPSVFYNVQFTYRVLMLVVLWGSLLSALVLAMTFRGMGPVATWACLLAVALAAAPYTVWRHGKLDRSVLTQVMTNPDLGSQAGIAYRPVVGKMDEFRLAPPAGVPVLPPSEVAQRLRRGATTTYYASLPESRVAQLPVLFYPGLLDVTLDHHAVPYGHIDGLVALEIPAGSHVASVRFAGVGWANVVSLVAALGIAAAGAVALVKRSARKRGGAPTRAPDRPSSRRPLSSAPPMFPTRAALFAFALLAVPLTLPAAYSPWKKFLQRRTVGTVRASSESNHALKAANAFDEDEATAWAARGSGPAVLTLQCRKARRVARVVLEPRRTILLEGWHKVGVVLYFGGNKVAEQTFVLPNAPSQPAQELRLDSPAKADVVEFHFSDPVTVTPDGGQVFDPSMVNPGYREIRIYPD